jgi:hypothetical protein
MTDLSFASMKKLFEDNWEGEQGGNVGYGNTVISRIRNANSHNSIFEYYGGDSSDAEVKAALEFGERAIKNRIPFVMIAFSLTPSTQGLNAMIESIQISEFKWINEGDAILLQKWDVDTLPSGLLEDKTYWTEEEVKEYFNAKALQINVVDDWALQGRELKMNVRQDYVMIIYSGILIPIPINFLAGFPLEEELREMVSDTKA